RGFFVATQVAAIDDVVVNERPQMDQFDGGAHPGGAFPIEIPSGLRQQQQKGGPHAFAAPRQQLLQMAGELSGSPGRDGFHDDLNAFQAFRHVIPGVIQHGGIIRALYQRILHSGGSMGSGREKLGPTRKYRKLRRKSAKTRRIVRNRPSCPRAAPPPRPLGAFPHQTPPLTFPTFTGPRIFRKRKEVPCLLKNPCLKTTTTRSPRSGCSYFMAATPCGKALRSSSARSLKSKRWPFPPSATAM